MKYAEEVIELMGCYPGREFRMGQILQYMNRGSVLSRRRRQAMRNGVLRVLKELEAIGAVRRVKEGETSAHYVWLARHGVV